MLLIRPLELIRVRFCECVCFPAHITETPVVFLTMQAAACQLQWLDLATLQGPLRPRQTILVWEEETQHTLLL